MQLGMIGLGRMGGNIVKRLMRDGHTCVVHTRDAKVVAEFVKEGATGASSAADLVAKLKAPRVVWIMLPAGEVTEQTIAEVSRHLDAGDIIIDGGNSFYKDDIRRAKALKERSVAYADIGVSGGVWGLERGYCMMIGGDSKTFDHIEPLLKTLAPGAGDIPRTPGLAPANGRAEQGYIHAGPVGAGHFVKMIHNGIEYGLMQAYAEGFDILKNKASETLPAEERFDINLTDVAEVWRRGSVVSSWLLDLTAQALAADDQLSKFTGAVDDSGEGRWTLNAAIEEAVPANVLAAALFARFRSRERTTFGDKLLSAMRFGFGGHIEGAVKPSANAG
jgi:6-phosphogluconate dehydrogenase